MMFGIGLQWWGMISVLELKYGGMHVDICSDGLDKNRKLHHQMSFQSATKMLLGIVRAGHLQGR